MPFSPADLMANPALAALIASKLAPNAIIDIQGCQVATTWGVKGMQQVANLLQATVIANTNDVTYNGLGSILTNTGQLGKWLEINPNIKNATIEQQRYAGCDD